jgi:hypothetical protein
MSATAIAKMMVLCATTDSWFMFGSANLASPDLLRQFQAQCGLDVQDIAAAPQPATLAIDLRIDKSYARAWGILRTHPRSYT